MARTRGKVHVGYFVPSVVLEILAYESSTATAWWIVRQSQ